MKKRIYLAGPITGLSYDGATEWREYVKGRIGWRYDVRDPLRWKTFLKNQEKISAILQPSGEVFGTCRAITTRDRYDVQSADLVLVNFLGAKQVSIGTGVELGWADARRVPIVMCMERGGNIHDHAFVREICGAFQTDSLQQAVDVVKGILG